MIIEGDAIPLFFLLQKKFALQLECVGLKHSQGSVAALIKQMLREHGVKPPNEKKRLHTLFDFYVQLKADEYAAESEMGASQ